MEKRSVSNFKNTEYAKRARRLIPGGAHTYSKGDDQFPANAPKIIDRGSGCTLWDVDGNEFVDLALSLGSVVLGHAYPPVIESVEREIRRGTNFCRPSVLEGELAELISEVIPGAEMVKFAKNGSDAVTAAVKLARAATGRKYVARCAQDPFNAIHDWFIGSTVINRGIPEEVKNLTLQFNYNDLDSCKKLIELHPGEIACFLLEPVSFIPPENRFLEQLKELCERNGIVLIFDEVVSGFRFDLGGAGKFAGVVPHLAAFGKAMGNGFSISALTGKRDLMELGGIDHTSERVFLLSTTHGGETHSIAAAITTIKEIIRTGAIQHFWQFGQKLINGINGIAADLGASNLVQASGYGCKPAIVYRDETGTISPVARTLFLQETIGRGILMPYVVPCLAHSDETLKQVLQAAHDAIRVMKEASLMEGGLKKALIGPEVKPVFRKFN